MPFFFENFPKTEYDIKKNNRKEVVTNIMLRYKISNTINKIKANYYDFSVEEGERPDIVATKIYKRPELDWLILMVNDIIDPNFDWPMELRTLENYIISKYGSLATAHATVHEYRKILNEQSRLFDGTVVPKRTLVIDETTYNTLSETSRESISKYQYEVDLNDSKRQIKVLDPAYLNDILNSIEDIFE